MGLIAYSQSTGYFRYDSIRMEKFGGNAELILLNSTRNATGGALINLGNGRTGFSTSVLAANQIDLFAIFGDSNGQGWGNSTLSPAIISGIAYQYYNNTLTAKTGDPIGNANTGSAWPAFANTWYTITGRKICFVPVGIPGSTMNLTADGGLGNWDSTGALLDTGIARTNRAMTALAAAGYTVMFRGVLTGLGGNDALAINASTINVAAYTQSFTKFRARIRSAFGPKTPIYIHQLGKQVTGTDAGHALVRAAQISATNADSLTNIVFWNAQYFITRSLQTDQYHYSQAGYNEMGRIMAEQIANSGGNKMQEQGNNIWFSKGNVGIGITKGIPTYQLDVSDSIRVSDMIFSRRGFAGAPSITTSSYLTIKAGQDILIQQSIAGSPAEYRFAQNDEGTSGTGARPFTGVINAFNFGAGGVPDIRRHLFITTGGTSNRAGNIVLKPNTPYWLTRDTTQNGTDSVIVELNTAGAFYVKGGKAHFDTDTVQVQNRINKAGDTTNYKPAVFDSNGNLFVGAWNGGGGGSGTVTSVAAGYGTSFTTITSSGSVVVDSAFIQTKLRGMKLVDSMVSVNNGRYAALLSGTGLVSFSGTTPTFNTTSSSIAGIISDETGSGAMTFATSPTFTTDITTPKINGSTAGSGTLTLMSTTNGTKGKILFGTSAYDEVNNRLGVGTAIPATTFEVAGTALVQALQLQGTGVNGNLFTASTTNMTSTSTSNYLLPGGSGTSFRVAINGTTASTLGSGQDAADLVLTGSSSSEFSSGTHPRIGTLFVGSKTVTNAAGSTDTLYGAYFNGPATGVTPNVGSWNSIFNNGDVLIKQGKLRIGGAGLGTAQIDLAGTTSGIVSVKTQAAAGTYNFNLPTTAGNSGEALISAGGGSSAMTWLALAQGTYTPTVAEVTNGGGAGGTTAYACQYSRTGNTVTVSGKITIDVNATSTLSEVSMTLPIASNFTAPEQAGGAAIPSNNDTIGLSIVANAAADKVYFTGFPATSVGVNYSFIFQYQIL